MLKQEDLGGGISAFVSKAHGFSTDALLLARFAAPGRDDRACDLGSGCGILPLLWCRDGLAREIAAVEIQEAACRQMETAVAHNRLKEKLHVLHADLRELKGRLPMGSFDLVTMNPPYYVAGSGLRSADKSAEIARHDGSCSLEEACAAGTALLRFGGRLCLCCRPERLVALLAAMSLSGAEPKRLRLAAKNPQSPPWLALVEARRGGKPGLKVEAGLFLCKADGSPTDELLEIYGEYKV